MPHIFLEPTMSLIKHPQNDFQEPLNLGIEINNMSDFSFQNIPLELIEQVFKWKYFCLIITNQEFKRQCPRRKLMITKKVIDKFLENLMVIEIFLSTANCNELSNEFGDRDTFWQFLSTFQIGFENLIGKTVVVSGFSERDHKLPCTCSQCAILIR